MKTNRIRLQCIERLNWMKSSVVIRNVVLREKRQLEIGRAHV